MSENQKKHIEAATLANKAGKILAIGEDGEIVLKDIPASEKAKIVRMKRDVLLKCSDKYMMEDYPNKPEKDALLAYRQALRDIPAQNGFPDDISWPAI